MASKVLHYVIKGEVELTDETPADAAIAKVKKVAEEAKLSPLTDAELNDVLQWTWSMLPAAGCLKATDRYGVAVSSWRTDEVWRSALARIKSDRAVLAATRAELAQARSYLLADEERRKLTGDLLTAEAETNALRAQLASELAQARAIAREDQVGAERIRVRLVGALTDRECEVERLVGELKSMRATMVSVEAQAGAERLRLATALAATQAERVLARYLGAALDHRDGSELVLIPGGEFLCGEPTRRETLPAFYLARYPVTNAQYARYLQANPQAAKPACWHDERFNQPQQPVVGVSWDEAMAYCHWAGLRLPTEWEWEKGARGTDGRRYPWGKDDPDPSRAVFGNPSGQPAPVGSCPAGASPYGLMDMAGNVWEWTASWYDEGKSRTVRGGAFDNHPQDLRSSIRGHNHPGPRKGNVGFRCAQDAG